MAYSPKYTFQLIDLKLLHALLRLHGLDRGLEDLDIQQLYEFVESTPFWAGIDADLREINSMGNEEGLSELLKFAKARGAELTDAYEDCGNDTSRSAWFFLEHREVFEDAYRWDYLVKDHGSEYRLNRDTPIAADFFTQEKLDMLKQAIQDHFKSERRAKLCNVEAHMNADNSTLCISTYFDDYSRSELGFENGKLQKKPRKPAKDLHFVVFLNEKKVSLQFKGTRYQKKEDLMRLFVESVLGEMFNTDNFRTVYLDELFDSSFSLESFIPPADNIDYVRIKSLRFDKKQGNSPQRVILDIKYGKTRQEIYEMIRNYHALNSEIWKITQATIHFQFKNLGQKGSVTTTLTVPNSDDLQDKPLHNKCRQYLTAAGLMS